MYKINNDFLHKCGETALNLHFVNTTTQSQKLIFFAVLKCTIVLTL